MDNRSSRTNRLFKTNPVISHIADVDAHAYEGGRATYRGIANKTLLLMLFTLLGYASYCVLSQRIFPHMAGAEAFTLGTAGVLALVCSFVATLSVGASPVAGPIYCVSEGYLLGYLSVTLLAGYEWISMLTIILTVLTVMVMAVMFAHGMIRANARFHTVLRAVFATLIAYAVISLIGLLLPFTAVYMRQIFVNPMLSVLSSLVGAAIAAMFLISDFETIANTVECGMPEQYEWPAAFGLAITIIWLYIKILKLLIRIYGRRKD